MINLNQLRSFHEAAKSQNFSEAARKLYVTQPAITGQVKALEEALDIRLFQKRGRNMVLTEAGVLLFRYAQEIFDKERELEHALGEMRELKRGLLRLGTSKTYARYLMPSLISRFRSAHPEIKVILDEGSSQEIANSLVELRNEIALVAARDDVKGVETIPFRDEEVLLILSPGHPLAHGEAIHFADLAPYFVIMKEQNSTTHKVVQEAFARHGLTPKILMETANVEFIKEMVERGEGISFLVRSSVSRELEKGTLVTAPIRDDALRLRVTIAYLADGWLAPAAKAFLEILKEVGAEEEKDYGRGQTSKGSKSARASTR